MFAALRLAFLARAPRRTLEDTSEMRYCRWLPRVHTQAKCGIANGHRVLTDTQAKFGITKSRSHFGSSRPLDQAAGMPTLIFVTRLIPFSVLHRRRMSHIQPYSPEMSSVGRVPHPQPLLMGALQGPGGQRLDQMAKAPIPRRQFCYKRRRA